MDRIQGGIFVIWGGGPDIVLSEEEDVTNYNEIPTQNPPRPRPPPAASHKNPDWQTSWQLILTRRPTSDRRHRLDQINHPRFISIIESKREILAIPMAPWESFPLFVTFSVLKEENFRLGRGCNLEIARVSRSSDPCQSEFRPVSIRAQTRDSKLNENFVSENMFL